MALWPWKSSGFLKPEEEEWQTAVWGWFLNKRGGVADLRQSPLVTPNAEFFPATAASGHERALAIFASVKQHARLADWPCELIEQPPRPGHYAADGAPQIFEERDPAGTLSLEGDTATISYDPELVGNPMKLIATFSHQLGAYVLSTLADPPPGGQDMQGRASDLIAVYLGFGVFGANAALNLPSSVDAFSQSWRTARHGYLTEPMWCYALAIFFALRGEDIERAKPFLKDHLFSDLRKAAAYLRKHPERMP
jgi:hypothetical protein